EVARPARGSRAVWIAVRIRVWVLVVRTDRSDDEAEQVIDPDQIRAAGGQRVARLVDRGGGLRDGSGDAPAGRRVEARGVEIRVRIAVGGHVTLDERPRVALREALRDRSRELRQRRDGLRLALDRLVHGSVRIRITEEERQGLAVDERSLR